jgi:hypothetical protein
MSFERDLRSLVLIGQSLGARVVLVEVQHITGAGVLEEPDPGLRRLWGGSVPAPSEKVLAGYVAYTGVLESVAAQTGSIFLSTREFGIAGRENYAADDPIHFNAEGADRMGREMAGLLIESGLVGAGDGGGNR